MHTAVQAAQAGYKVWATMRDVSKADRLLEVATASGVRALSSLEEGQTQGSASASGEVAVDQLDVQDDTSIQASVERLLSRNGKLDVVVNCAGVGMLGTVETCTVPEIESHFDINVYGATRLIHHTMPTLRSQGKGHMVFLSSVSGFRAIPCSEIYAGSKHALEGILEGFAAVARLSGVYVTIVEPGPVRTSFLENLKNNTGSRDTGEAGRALAKLMENFAAHNSARLENASLPSGSDVARKIVQITLAEDPPLRLQPDEYSKQCAAEILVKPSGQLILQRNRQFLFDLCGRNLKQ